MKQIRKPFNIVMTLVLLIAITVITIAFSSWLITDEITEKPYYQPGTVAKYYLDNQSATYNGSEQAPTSTLFKESELSYQYKKSGDTTYTSGKPMNAGTYDIKVTIKDNNEEVEVSYVINPKSLGDNFGIEIVGGDKFQQLGTAITPEITLTDTDISTTLKKDTDYTLSYENNILAGTAKIIITGTGNYTGTIEQEFTIFATGKLEVLCTNMQELTYNGKTQAPVYTVECGGTEITDAIVEIQFKTLAGTYATGTPTTKGTYWIKIIAKKDGYETSDAKEVQMTINPKEITITWENLSFIYNRTAQCPTASSADLENDGTTIVVNDKKTNAGTYTATASVYGEKAENYTIKAGATSSFTIKPVTLTLNKYLIEMSYNSSKRTWALIQSTISSELSLNGILSGDTVTLSVSGMNDGTFGYGTDATLSGMNNNDKTGITTYTNVVGSTYSVKVVLTGSAASNYILSTGTPVIFKYKTAKVNNTYYTIEDAITKGTGDITFEGDATNTTSFVYSAFSNLASGINPYYENYNEYLISGRKLIIPCNTTVSDTKYSQSAKSGSVYSSLYIPSSISIKFTNKSNLLADGVIGFSQPDTTITCQRGVLYNNGYISIANGCTLDSYGYIKGFGTIDLANGATATDCMHTYDWPGGSAASDMCGDVLPTNAWSAHNISCKIKIYAGAEYKALVYTYLSKLGITKDAAPISTLIGSSSSGNCLFKVTRGYVEKEAVPAASWEKGTADYNELYLVTGSNQKAGQRDSVKIYGDCEDSVLNISIKIFITVNLKTGTSKAATVGFMDISVEENSKFTLTQSDYLFLPGSNLIVKEGATLTVGSNVDITMASWSEINALKGGFKSYCKDQVDAKANINGTVIVNGNIGGNWGTTSENAILNISGGNTTSSYKTMLGYTKVDGEYYAERSTAATGNVNGAENTNLSKIVYISINNNGTYCWVEATNVTEFTLNFYDSDTLLETKTILVVGDTTYTVTGSEYIPSKKFYDFTNWTLSDGTNANGKVLSGAVSINLYANWTLHKYSVIYNIEYEDCEELSTELINRNFDTFTYDDLANTLSFVKAKDGTLFFDGWYIDSEYTIKLPNNEITLSNWEKYGSYVEDGLTLYGKFTNVTKYEITFVTNEPEMDTPNMQVVSSASEVKLPDVSTFETNKNFERYLQGWYTTSDCQPGTEFSDSTVLTGNTTLYAKWSDKYKITFNVNGTETYKYIMPGEGITDILPNTSRDDTKEDKYYTKWIYLGLSKTNGATTADIDINTEIPTGNTTYYAIYSGKKYSKLSITITDASMTVSYKVYTQNYESTETVTRSLSTGSYEFIVSAGQSISFTDIKYSNSKTGYTSGSCDNYNYIVIDGVKTTSGTDGKYKVFENGYYAKTSQPDISKVIEKADIVVVLYSTK